MHVQPSVAEYVAKLCIAASEGSKQATEHLRAREATCYNGDIQIVVKLNQAGEVAKAPGEAVAEMTFSAMPR